MSRILPEIYFVYIIQHWCLSWCNPQIPLVYLQWNNKLWFQTIYGLFGDMWIKVNKECAQLPGVGKLVRPISRLASNFIQISINASLSPMLTCPVEMYISWASASYKINKKSMDLGCIWTSPGRPGRQLRDDQEDIYCHWLFLVMWLQDDISSSRMTLAVLGWPGRHVLWWHVLEMNPGKY